MSFFVWRANAGRPLYGADAHIQTMETSREDLRSRPGNPAPAIPLKDNWTWALETPFQLARNQLALPADEGGKKGKKYGVIAGFTRSAIGLMPAGWECALSRD